MVNYLDILDEKFSNIWFEYIKNNKRKFNIIDINCNCECHNNSDLHNLSCFCNCSKIKYNIQTLSRNKNITWNIIKNNLDIKWNWTELSKHDNISIDIIKNNQSHPWDYFNGVSKNKNLTSDFVENMNNITWNYYVFTWDFNKNFNFVKDNLNKNWNWLHISSNIDLDKIKKYPEMPWNKMGVSLNKKIDISFIKNFNNLILWGAPGLSSNSSFKWFWVEEFPNKNWDYYMISKLVDLNNFDKIPNIKENIMSICFNKNLTWKYIKSNPQIKWDYDIISYNKTVNWKIINENSKLFKNYYYISCNKNITFDIFYNNINKEWDYFNLFKHIDFDWENLSKLENLFYDKNNNLDCNNLRCIYEYILFNNMDGFKKKLINKKFNELKILVLNKIFIIDISNLICDFLIK